MPNGFLKYIMLKKKFKLFFSISILIYSCGVPNKKVKKSFNHSVRLFELSNTSLLELATTSTSEDSINRPFLYNLKNILLPAKNNYQDNKLFISSNDTATLKSLLLTKEASKYVNNTDTVLISSNLIKKENTYFAQVILVSKNNFLIFDNKRFKQVEYGLNNVTGNPELKLEFDSIGKKEFADYTTINTNKVVAFFIDNEFYTAPRIMMPITNGSISISGDGKKIEDFTKLFTEEKQ
jgi:hypothetical protein